MSELSSEPINPCVKLMRHLWTLLDGECTEEFTPEDRDELLAHLRDCPPCEDHYRLEERINAMVATKCQGEATPHGFRERLQVEISRTTIIQGR